MLGFFISGWPSHFIPSRHRSKWYNYGKLSMDFWMYMCASPMDLCIGRGLWWVKVMFYICSHSHIPRSGPPFNASCRVLFFRSGQKRIKRVTHVSSPPKNCPLRREESWHWEPGVVDGKPCTGRVETLAGGSGAAVCGLDGKIKNMFRWRPHCAASHSTLTPTFLLAWGYLPDYLWFTRVIHFIRAKHAREGRGLSPLKLFQFRHPPWKILPLFLFYTCGNPTNVGTSNALVFRFITLPVVKHISSTTSGWLPLPALPE